MALIDTAIYVNGRRTNTPDPRGMAWVDLYRPTRAEMRSVADEFALNPLAVENAQSRHRRAKLERFGETLFVVLRTARYTEAAEFGEVQLFVGPESVVTVRHAANPDLARVRRDLEANPALLAGGPEAVLCAIIGEVVDGYDPVITCLESDIDEIQDQLFAGSDRTVSRRIFELLRQVMALQRATESLERVLGALALDEALDRAARITEQAGGFRALLESALAVHSTLFSQKQNEEIKKISAWAAILFAPTLIGTIYGMNFTNMPELDWPLGYPLALLAMLVFGAVLYGIFRLRGWL